MTTQTEVQGIVQALFGAYAGGYLTELTDEAEANGSAALADRLATIQGVILGRDLSDDQDFVDTILWNLGVQSTDDAYDAASAWAMTNLDAGASRSDIVYAAVVFLEAIAAGTIEDSNYTAIAEAFAASVEAGIAYSETDAGSAEYSLADLQTAAGIDTSVFNLDAALAALVVAEAAEADALAAAEDVAAANFIALGYSVYDLDSDDALSATELASFKTAYVAANPALDAAAATLAVTDAETALAAARGDTIDTTGLATALAIYDGLAASDARLDAMLATAQAEFDADANGDIADAQAGIDTAETALTDGIDAEGSNIALLEALRDAIMVEDLTALYVSGGTETLADVLVLALEGLASDATAYDVEDAIFAIALLGTADTGTDVDDVGALIEARDGLIIAVAGAETLYFAVDEVADYVAVQALVNARDALVAAVTDAEDLVDAVTPTAEAYADALTALNEIDFGDWSTFTPVVGSIADTTDDIYLATDPTDADITDFGASGTDLIYFGTGYSLVTMVPEDETAADIDGDVSSLEIFVVDDGTDIFLHVEINAFDGSTDSNGDIVTIELTGKTGSTVSLTTSGFLSIA